MDISRFKPKSNGKTNLSVIDYFIQYDQKEYDGKLIFEKINEADLKKSIRFLTKLNFPSILKVIDYIYPKKGNQTHNPTRQTKDFYTYPVIITEHMPNKSLKDVLHSIMNDQTPKGWTDTKVYITIVGVAFAMLYLHNNNIYYNDLSLSGILFDDMFYPHVSFLNIIHNITQGQENGKSLIYVDSATENTEDPDYFKADVFAFSLIIHQLFKKEILRKRPDADRGISTFPEAVRKLYLDCHNSDPDSRMTFAEIVNFIKDEVFQESFDLLDKKEADEYLNYIEGAFNTSIPLLSDHDSSDSYKSIAHNEKEDEKPDQKSIKNSQKKSPSSSKGSSRSSDSSNSSLLEEEGSGKHKEYGSRDSINSFGQTHSKKQMKKDVDTKFFANSSAHVISKQEKKEQGKSKNSTTKRKPEEQEKEKPNTNEQGEEPKKEQEKGKPKLKDQDEQKKDKQTKRELDIETRVKETPEIREQKNKNRVKEKQKIKEQEKQKQNASEQEKEPKKEDEKGKLKKEEPKKEEPKKEETKKIEPKKEEPKKEEPKKEDEKGKLKKEEPKKIEPKKEEPKKEEPKKEDEKGKLKKEKPKKEEQEQEEQEKEEQEKEEQEKEEQEKEEQEKEEPEKEEPEKEEPEKEEPEKEEPEKEEQEKEEQEKEEQEKGQGREKNKKQEKNEQKSELQKKRIDDPILICKQKADDGDIEEMVSYGKMLFHGEGVTVNFSEAAYYFKKAADGGSTEGQFRYGHMLRYGFGVKLSKERASEYFLMASKGEGIGKKEGLACAEALSKRSLESK